MAKTIPVFFENFEGEKFRVGEASQPDEKGNIKIALNETDLSQELYSQIHDGVMEHLSIDSDPDVIFIEET